MRSSLHLSVVALLCVAAVASLPGLACSSASSEDDSPDAAPGGEAGAVDGGEPGADAASGVPLLDVALKDHCPGGAPPGTGVNPGADLHKVTLSKYPDALCNDGSPAVMYVRKSSAPAATNKWIVHMQAGGSCSTYDVCLQRWCGIGPYDAAKMSSRFAPNATSGTGMFARNGANAFGPANQVYIYYCSSDAWLGRRSDAVLDDPTGANVPFRLHFRGHDILEAAADALTKGVTSDDGVEALPPMSSATEVLFSGSSAGSNGLTQQLDWWASKVPGAKAYGMLDAIYLPLPEDIDDAAVAGKYVTGIQYTWSDVRTKLYAGFADESCVAAHPGADAYLCALSTHVQLNHLTTPFFTRQDLTDPVAYQYIEGAGGSLAQYAAWTRASMLRLADVKANAEEKAAITTTPGAYSSNCGQHIVLLNGPWFGVAATGNATVQGQGGAPLTVHDALGAWATGTPIFAVDTAPSTLSSCAKTTKDQ